MNKKIEAAVNEQINAEMYSAYLYLSMSGYFQSKGLTGFAKWMEIQAAEEFSHAKRFYDYLFHKGGRISLKPIQGPPGDWDSTENVFHEVLKHEEKVTSLINSLVDLAIQEKDHATNNMLQWFVSEQVEEEANATDIINKIKLIGNDGNGLFMIDKELGVRVLDPLIFQSMTV